MIITCGFNAFCTPLNSLFTFDKKEQQQHDAHCMYRASIAAKKFLHSSVVPKGPRHTFGLYNKFDIKVNLELPPFWYNIEQYSNIQYTIFHHGNFI